MGHGHQRSFSNVQIVKSPAENDNISHRLSNYKTVVQQTPAQYRSVIASAAGTNNNKPTPAYGTTNDNGEVVSVKGHLQDLEVFQLNL